jgi:hypothetical protein
MSATYIFFMRSCQISVEIDTFFLAFLLIFQTPNRDFGRSRNQKGDVVIGGHNLSLLVDIGLTDLENLGEARALPCLPTSDIPAKEKK